MLPSGGGRHAGRCRILACALAALTVALVQPVDAQIGPGQSVPARSYLNTLPLHYDMQYRDALGAFLNESRSGIKTTTSQWIDSICYFTMAGESYYELGQMPQALESYTAALKLYVAYSDWMMRVQFPPAINPATSGVVRATPWGQSKRGARVGNFPETFLMGQGQIDNSAAVYQGGVVRQAVLFPVHVSEIVRCTSLAIRRRRQLLGPVSKFDPVTKDLVDVLSRRPGPPNHWSEAWVGVQLGCALAAAGNTAQANTTLQRALLVGGEFDHPLTSTALLELGQLALEAGDFVKAGYYAEEASYCCANFLNPANLEEAFRLGLLAHTLLNQRVAYTPLVPAIAWARTQGYRELQLSLLLLSAENLAIVGQTAQAADLLATARGVAARSDALISRIGARLNHMAALVAYQAGNTDAGDQAIGNALDFMRNGSHWLFQIGLADDRYTGGQYTDRVGLSLYETLLREPAAADWTMQPLESLALLSTPHGAAIEHWFEAALRSTKENELALEIADRARRHRFYSTLPLGGRLLALRWMLEGTPDLLGQPGMLQRQELLMRYPKYQQLAAEAAKIRAKLAAKPLVEEAVEARRQQAAQLTSLADISAQQEVILREMAVRRQACEMVFPPLRTTKEVQQSMPEGQVLLAFFATSRNLYAFLYSHEKYAAWHVASSALLQKQVTNLLRELGNFDQNHELTPAELAKDSWRATAGRVMSLLLEKSNVDLAGNFNEIVIVPDGILWYLPFEALPLGKPPREQLLLSHARVRYAPTVGLATPYGRTRKPQPNVAVALGKLFPQDDEAVATGALEELGKVVPGTIGLPRALPAASHVYRLLTDNLVVLDDIKPASGPYDWSPMPDRGKHGSSLVGWLSLPWGGPEVVVLPGFHTLAESGLRKPSAAGNDLFLALCGLMSSGARTILISRWRVGGQTTVDLVREFVQELPHASPAEAWQRSVQIAGDAPIDPLREPRIKKASGIGELKGNHPFFWSGYMLADCPTLRGDEPIVAAEQPPNPVPIAVPPNPAPVEPAPEVQPPPARNGAKAAPRIKEKKSSTRRVKPAAAAPAG
jgi:hypothetical protein